MKLLIKQRVFTLTDTYYVYDEVGNIRYDVKDALFSIGHQLHVYDHQTGREVGSIHQKFFTFMPQFEIVVNGQFLGTVKKEFTFFVPKYRIDYLGWQVEGDFMGWDYRATQNGRPVVSISKELFKWSDTYSLDFPNPANEIPALMLVLAIDAVNCSNNN